MYKVVLVDDEPIITQGLQALLEWEGYGFEVVYTAENGTDALAYIKDHPIDLLITDIMMPKMTGLELIEEVKGVQPEVKCVVLSGYQEFDYVKQGVELGIENYLLKPVDEEELIKTVQSVSEKLGTSSTVIYDEGATTLKDNTLWRVLNGEIAREDWQERLAIYSMNMEAAYYSVAILHFEHDHDFNRRNEIRNYIEANYAATCLYNPDQELIVIFEFAEEEEGDSIHDHLITTYLPSIHTTIGDFYLAVGEAVSEFEEIEASYTTAREMALYQVSLHPNQKITKETVVDVWNILKLQQEVKSELSKKVLQSMDDVATGLELFTTSLQVNEHYVSHTVVRRYAIDLISYLHHSIQVEGFYLHTTSIENLIHATDVSEMMQIIRVYCHNLFDQIHNKSNTYSPVIQDVLDYMHQHYDQELSLKTLSQRFYVNAIYLGQLFQKELGVVFSEYINHYRLEKAKDLLKNTHLGAGEIGKQVGYSDTTYFYKQFKRNVGATPTEWRNI